jgi:hypothetical protein
MSAADEGPTDLLTRTTLRLDGGLTSVALAEMVRVLHRVPGVLRAELDAAGARAVVAHDGAVSAYSLVAAAAAAGVRVRIVTAMSAAERRDGTQSDPASRRSLVRIVGVSACAFLAAALLDVLTVSHVDARLVLPVIVGAFCVSFVAVLTRSRS